VLRRLSLIFISLAGICAFGQNAISAKSGMVHYVEGKVLLDGKVVEPKFGEFPQVNNNQTLTTEDGRAEVLLTPGVFLRLAEGSSFRMLSNRLSDTAVEILSGSAMFEVDELLKDNAITVHFKNGSIALVKLGLYRFDTDAARLRVFDGEARITEDQHTVTAKKGKQIVFGEKLEASNFDTKATDPFYRWASRRSEYIAAANVSSARTAYASGLTSSYGSWAWNPWFGMFTFLPGIGYGYNPFGWAYFSPYTVGYLYVPYYYGGGGGYYGYAGNTGRGRPTLGSNPSTGFNGNAGEAGLSAARATPPSMSDASSGGFSPAGNVGIRGGGGGGFSGGSMGGGGIGAAAASRGGGGGGRGR